MYFENQQKSYIWIWILYIGAIVLKFEDEQLR